jgi:mono/diheme cytochrome c family protein
LKNPTKWLVGYVIGVSVALTSLWAAERGDTGPGGTVQKPPLREEMTEVNQGKLIYDDRCADCHGDLGKGDGAAATDLEPRPADLTRPALAEQSDDIIFKEITDGKQPMPSYKTKLTDEQRWQVVRYVRTLTVNGKRR